MSYEHMRRSSRIPKEISILLTGSDMEGRGFSEMTKTVLLSRHGAGIVSTHKLYAEQEVIIRYLDTNKEALVRVVGRIGSEDETYTYGVAFVDPGMIDFWGIDFPLVSEKEKLARRVLLECATCGSGETVEHMDVESDVLIINEGIVRYCKHCHDSTLWKRSSDVPQGQPVLVAAGRDASSSAFAGATSTLDSPASPASEISMNAPISAPAPPPTTSPKAAAQTPALVIPPVKPENRRKHTRTKVSYKACIRRSGFNDDVVPCEDMSKGGLSFTSRKRYFENVEIEVAVPYSAGANAIFVPARIAWVVEIIKDKQDNCGVAYRITSRAS